MRTKGTSGPVCAGITGISLDQSNALMSLRRDWHLGGQGAPAGRDHLAELVVFAMKALSERPTARLTGHVDRVGRLAAHSDIALEARRLCALLDGLTVQAGPARDRLDAEAALAVLRRLLVAPTTR